MSIKIFLFISFYFYFLKISLHQNSSNIIASVQYKVKYSKDRQILIDDICQLDIDKNRSYFYSKGELENLHKIAEKVSKAEKAGNDINLGQIDSKDFKQNLCTFKILKEYSQKKAIYIQYVGQQYLGYVKDSLSTKRWKILKESKKINNLLCFKATMRKDTSTITAWFCPEIPFQDGPLSYYGLPGLILKASSTSGFETNLVSIVYNKDAKKEINIEPYILVSQAQIVRAATNQNAVFKTGKLPNGDEAKQISREQ